MNVELDALEARVIGCLLEKEVTTPDQYPLSLNALRNAVNQKSSRDPVMNLDEAQVQQVVDDLRSKAIRRVELYFDTPIEGSVFEAVPGVRDARTNEHSIVMSFDGQMDQLLKTATTNYNLVDISSEEADLEEIFLTYYEDEEVPA